MSANLPELAKSAFEAEVVRRSSLLGAVGFPTTILTALLAGLYASFSQLTLPLGRLEFVAAFCGLVALGLVAISGFHLATSLVSHEYQYPANIRDIHLWYEQVLATGRDKAEADEQLDAYLTAEYVKCGAHNTARNDLRSYQL